MARSSPGQEVRLAEEGPHVGRDLVLRRRLLDGLVPVPVLPGGLSRRSDEVFVGHGRRSGPPLRRRGRPLEPLIAPDLGLRRGRGRRGGRFGGSGGRRTGLIQHWTTPHGRRSPDRTGASRGRRPSRPELWRVVSKGWTEARAESDLARNVAPGSGTNSLRAGEGQTSWRDATSGLWPPGPVRRPCLRRLGMRGALLKSVEKALVA